MPRIKRALSNNPLIELDRGLILAVIGLLAIGLTMNYSSGHAQGNLTYFYKQSFVAGFGILLVVVLMILSPRVYYSVAYISFAALIIGLVLVSLSGVTGFGARRWLSIGGFQFQPSEPAKIALILAISRYLSDIRGRQSSWATLGVVAAFALPVFLLIILQPDLGTATVIPVAALSLLIWYGLPLRYFVILALPVFSLFLSVAPWIIAPAVLAGLGWIKRQGVRSVAVVSIAAVCIGATQAAPMTWSKLEPYQKKRLTSFLNPASDPLGSGYQVIQSKVAIGSGGLMGMGFLQGTQTQLRFLPQQHTDFIFSLAGEEFGFVGTSLILFLYFLFVWRSYVAASRIKNQFLGAVTAGITTMILYHAVINIGMTIGVLPVTGLPLPFLSYGGSFLLSCMISSGIILSACVHRREY